MLKKRRSYNRSYGGDAFIFLVLGVFSVLMLLPMIYAFSNALKPLDELFIYPPRFFARNPNLQNFKTLFLLFDNARVPLSRYLFNTVFVTVVGTAGQVIVSSMCAYAIAKLRFPGREVIFRIIVVSLMFNSVVTGITNFLVIRALGLLDTYWAVIVPTFSSSLGLYLMKQFMEQMVPDTVLEAAKIDGAGAGYTFFRIVMPMVRPAWLTLIIFAFQSLWNIGASPYVFSEQYKTVNYALSQVLAGGVARTGAAAAGTVLTMLVPIVMFLFTQSNVVETMATSGMKDG